MKPHAILLLTLLVCTVQQAHGQTIAFDPTQPVAGSPATFSIEFGGAYALAPSGIQIAIDGFNIEITVATVQIVPPTLPPQTYSRSFTVPQAGTYTYSVRMLDPLGGEILQASGSLAVVGGGVAPGAASVIPVGSDLVRGTTILLLLLVGMLAISRKTS